MDSFTGMLPKRPAGAVRLDAPVDFIAGSYGEILSSMERLGLEGLRIFGTPASAEKSLRGRIGRVSNLVVVP